MQPSARYRLQLPEKGESGWLVDAATGERTTPVDGLLVEAQFLLDDGRSLVWLTDDAPYDEGLHVYLVNQRGTLDDALHAGAPWSSGILEIAGTGDRWVDFAFFRDGARFRLSVAADAEFHFALPKGFGYGSRFRRHSLSVREIHPTP